LKQEVGEMEAKVNQKLKNTIIKVTPIFDTQSKNASKYTFD